MVSDTGEVLIGILNNLKDFAIARDQHWYRIPSSSFEGIQEERNARIH
jgi:hypothetical protein